jgi:hypothetical protein
MTKKMAFSREVPQLSPPPLPPPPLLLLLLLLLFEMATLIVAMEVPARRREYHSAHVMIPERWNTV